MICTLAEGELHDEDAFFLFYVLFLVFVNMDTFRDNYIYYRILWILNWVVARKPKLNFQTLLDADFLPLDHPMRQLLSKLNEISKSYEDHFEEQNTMDWDIIFSSLLTRITAFFLSTFVICSMAIYCSSKQHPSPSIGISDSSIVLQLIFLSLQTVFQIDLIIFRLLRTRSEGLELPSISYISIVSSPFFLWIFLVVLDWM